MRERAEGASAAVGEVWVPQSLGFGYPQPVYNSRMSLVAEAYGGPEMAIEVAGYIASWRPGVALAVADWLDEVADDRHPELPAWVETAAFAVARAYLGGTT